MSLLLLEVGGMEVPGVTWNLFPVHTEGAEPVLPLLIRHHSNEVGLRYSWKDKNIAFHISLLPSAANGRHQYPPTQ